MNSTKRSHKQNVDSLEVLITQVRTFEPVFNPSETRLTITNQEQIKSKGDQVLTGVISAETASNNAISARTAAFDNFDGLITRVIGALRISDVPEQTITQAESIVRELRHKRASEIVPPVVTEEGKGDGAQTRRNKLHTGSMNTKIENFGKLIMLLSTLPAYKPNETDLTIAALGAKLEALKQANTVCITADAAADAARKQRNMLLYTDKTGLVDIALDSKQYVKSAYGATSPQYKSVRGILFTKIR